MIGALLFLASEAGAQTIHPDTRRRLEQRLESQGQGAEFGQIMTGTVIGGVAGGVALGALAFYASERSGGGDIESLGAVISAFFGGSLGYAFGSAAGAYTAASSPKPPLAPVLAMSVMGTAAGMLIATPFVLHTEAWPVGVSLGAAAHLLLTTETARRLRPVRDGTAEAPEPASELRKCSICSMNAR